MPQVSFSRDSTTEIPIQLLLFTALWILCDRRTLRQPRPAFVAGLLLGLVQAMHVDGLAFLVGLPAVFAITWLHTNRAGRDRLRRRHPLGGAGVAVGLAARRPRPLPVGPLLPLGRARERRAPGRGRDPRDRRRDRRRLLVRRTNVFHGDPAGAGERSHRRSACSSLIGGFGAWLVRPHVQHVHAGPQSDGRPTCSGSTTCRSTERSATPSSSVRWISWYVGPITLTHRDHRRRRAHDRARARLAAAPGADRDVHARAAGAPVHLASDDHARPDLGGPPLPARGVPRASSSSRSAVLCALARAPDPTARRSAALARDRARDRDRRASRGSTHPQRLADDRTARSVPGDHSRRASSSVTRARSWCSRTSHRSRSCT